MCRLSGQDFTALCADRTAVERVYYSHQLGSKPPFEQAMPASLIEHLVKSDLHKQAVLKSVYGIQITDAMTAAEIQRINATTRAPDILAELKAALGNDPDRFATTVARPILVERLLHDKFNNDDVLHAAQRHETETARTQLLAAKNQDGSVTNLLACLKHGRTNQVAELNWTLGPPPAETNGPDPGDAEIKARFGTNAQLLSPSRADGPLKLYFADLPSDLQKVLAAQLRQAGDISATIEAPSGFLLYLATAKSADTLAVAVLSVPKRSYEEWLAQQPDAAPPP